MLVATWNINSVRARRGRLLSWLERHQPDVLALQELKVVDEEFPVDEVRELGYHATVHGQKTYNGVALLSRSEPSDPVIGMGDAVADDHARIVGATIEGAHFLSCYFPNGANLESDKYPYKLRWMERLRGYLDRRFSPDQPVVLMGDFNVAPFADDVSLPDQLEGTVLANDDVRGRLAAIREFGLQDVVRPFHPEGGVYTWWDYRGRGFERNHGLRIDHVYATPCMASGCVGAMVDREERHGSTDDGEGPSDHAPLLVEFASSGHSR